jgi:hypothetical protein
MRLTSRGRLGINTTAPTELLDVDGNIKCTGTISTSGHLIYNYLFNNTGGNHGDITDFNAVSHFGYKFILGNTNGPTTAYNQFYHWYIGLGINYPASGTSSHGCQFAMPRNTNNPYLCKRSFFKNEIYPHLFFGENIEDRLMTIWSKKDYKCVFGPGLFTHNRAYDGHS